MVSDSESALRELLDIHGHLDLEVRRKVSNVRHVSPRLCPIKLEKNQGEELET